MAEWGAGTVKSKCKCQHQDKNAPPPPPTHTAPYLFYNKVGVGAPGQTIAGPPSKLAEGTSSLHGVLGSLRREEIEQLILNDPSIVHEKGFNGQLPLHKAVLASDIEVIDMLLQYDADVEARNNFDETPFHFACKRGNIQIMHLLAENNADLTLVDKAGKGPIHHAAHGGSVLALHYLTEVHHLTTHVRDANLSTPLHVVCAHGHVEALRYLLRKDRSDLFAQNAHANNALHLAANAGHGWTCYYLLEEGGLQLLHEQNREGKNPLSLICNSLDPKYKETLTLLNYYTKSRKKTGAVSGPVIGWYIHGVLPVLAYPLVLLLASLTSRPGTFTVAGFVVMLFVLFQHKHRMNHICKWPNPVFFGMFLAGWLHSSICFYVQVVPVVYSTYTQTVNIMALWNLVFLFLYYRLLTGDPGHVKESTVKPGSLWPYSVRDIAVGNIRPESLCTHCEVIPAKMSHHCKLCLKCCLNTDHHCLFLYRCIGRNNHRIFIFFITLVTCGMLGLVAMCVVYVHILYPDYSYNMELWGVLYNEQVWVWTVCLSNAFSVIWGVNLLRFQLKVISKAQTTVYQPNKGHTSLSVKQRLYNVVYFLAGKGYYMTDTKTVV